MTTKPLRDLRWAACGLAAFPFLPQDESFTALVHAPAEGSSWATALRFEQVLDGGELSVEMGGEPVPGMYLPDVYLEMSDVLTLEFVDTYVSAAGDAPPEWLRRYDDTGHTNEGALTISMPDQGDTTNPWTAEASSELPGSVVRFRGDEVAELVEGTEGDWIDELRADLTFGALLPEERVRVGDSWSVDGEPLELLLEPAGELGHEYPPEAAEYLERETDSTVFSGAVELTLRALEDGRAEIVLDGEIERVEVGPGDLSEVPVVDGTATNTYTDSFTVSGTLEWDRARGGLAELAVEGTVLSETLTVRDEGQPGPTYQSTYRVEGTWSLEVEVRAEAEAVEVALGG